MTKGNLKHTGYMLLNMDYQHFYLSMAEKLFRNKVDNPKF